MVGVETWERIEESVWTCVMLCVMLCVLVRYVKNVLMVVESETNDVGMVQEGPVLELQIYCLHLFQNSQPYPRVLKSHLLPLSDLTDLV